MPTVRWNKKWNNGCFWEKDGDEWDNQAVFCNQPYNKWKKSIVENFIYKNIDKDSNVLEIAPGHGRWTEFILKKAGNLILCDLNSKCIEICKMKFYNFKNISYYVNDGKNLNFIKDNSIDFIWSYDSFVHMEKDVIEAYFKEFSRILKVGGKAIIHHSGERRSKGFRSNVSTGIIREIATQYGLSVKYHIQSWGKNNEFNCKLFNDYISELVKQ